MTGFEPARPLRAHYVSNVAPSTTQPHLHILSPLDHEDCNKVSATLPVMNVARIVSISRPRFWLYEFGTYIIGILIAYNALREIIFSWEVLIFGIYFLVPANILIYGINDIFDYETDINNPKKVEYEDVLMPDQHRSVYWWILITNIPFVLYTFTVNNAALTSFLLFLFFATFYSAKPIRAKARPFLDSFFSASHYVVTGVFGYLLLVGTWSAVNWWLVTAPLLWAIAMHAYSAVPDIQADSESDLETFATRLGRNKTIVVCAALYGVAFCILSLVSGSLWWMVLALPYLYLMYVSYKANDQKLFETYTYFPYLNALVGTIITIYLLSGLLN